MGTHLDALLRKAIQIFETSFDTSTETEQFSISDALERAIKQLSLDEITMIIIVLFAENYEIQNRIFSGLAATGQSIPFQEFVNSVVYWAIFPKLSRLYKLSETPDGRLRMGTGAPA